MRRTIYLTALALFPFLPGCGDKLNPPVEDLPASDFQYVVKEQRQLKDFTWEDQGGGVLSNGEESICQLYVTSFNEVSLEASTPVNISSSQPGYVAVEKVTSKKYRLVYKGDGASHIKVWNGTEGQNAIVRGFDVIGIEYVDIKGLRFSLGTDKDHTKNPVFVFSRFTTSRPPIRCNFPDDTDNIDKNGRPGTSDFMCMPYMKPMWYNYDYGEYGRYEEDITQGALLTFEGLEPENASFRTITSFESEWDAFRDFTRRMARDGYFNEGDYVWPNIHSCNYDVSHFTSPEDPTDMWISWNSDCYIALLRIPVAEGARYYYVFRANDEECVPIYPDVN
ncbi:MAG: hypothetical protein E7109_09415 [Bacteroidales bacterium]|nr:hypothetical protein [Bacteroidales bacterium]